MCCLTWIAASKVVKRLFSGELLTRPIQLCGEQYDSLQTQFGLLEGQEYGRDKLLSDFHPKQGANGICT